MAQSYFNPSTFDPKSQPQWQDFKQYAGDYQHNMQNSMPYVLGSEARNLINNGYPMFNPGGGGGSSPLAALLGLVGGSGGLGALLGGGGGGGGARS